MTDPERLCVGCFHTEPRGSVCPRCDYDESVERVPLFLPLRTVLDQQYLVGRELGRPGGFGITYLALDQRLQDRVAIKEYLPPAVAGRKVDRLSVQANSTQDGDFFRYGLGAFNEEARTLAAFRHPNIVRVRTFLQANDTAYMVMDYYEGETFEEYLLRHDGRISQADALRLIDPIFTALSDEVHAKDYLHRDISPQNVYLASLPGEQRPLLIDFGAARQALGDRSQSLSVVLKQGYAPFEQYYSKGQGPWTDVYACAATLYRAVTGTVPPPAVERIESDPLVPPDQLVAGLTREFSEALVWGLTPRYQDRPQTIDAFRQRLLPPIEPIEPIENAPEGIPVLRGVHGELSGQVVSLEEPVIIGREAEMSNIVLSRSDFSRQHCAVEYDAGRGVFEVWDLESSNGTFVESRGMTRALAKGGKEVLLPGDRFHLIDPTERFELALLPVDPDKMQTEDLPDAIESIRIATEEPQGAAEAPPPLPELAMNEAEGESEAMPQPYPETMPARKSNLGWWLAALLVAAAVVAAIIDYGGGS